MRNSSEHIFVLSQIYRLAPNLRLTGHCLDVVELRCFNDLCLAICKLSIQVYMKSRFEESQLLYVWVVLYVYFPIIS